MPARRNPRSRLELAVSPTPESWNRAPKRSYKYTPHPPNRDSESSDTGSVDGLGFSPPHQRRRIPSPGERSIGGVGENALDGGDEYWGEHAYAYNGGVNDLEEDESQEEEEGLEEGGNQEEEQLLEDDANREQGGHEHQNEEDKQEHGLEDKKSQEEEESSEEEEESFESEESQEEEESFESEESQEEEKEEESFDETDDEDSEGSQKLEHDSSKKDEKLTGILKNHDRKASELTDQKQGNGKCDVASQTDQNTIANRSVQIQNQDRTVAGNQVPFIQQAVCSIPRMRWTAPPPPTYCTGNVINDQYKVLSPVGAGSYGCVLHAKDLKRRIDVALKVTKGAGAYALDEGQQEMKQLVKLNALDPEDDKHIVRLLGLFELEMRSHLVFELLSLSLADAINQSLEESARYPVPGLSFSETMTVAFQLIQAVEFMHRANVIHCDLKPDNIMLKNGSLSTIKVIDFGCAMDAIEGGNPTPRYCIQSLQYRAPELIAGYETFFSAIDMWSLGCIVAECYTGCMLLPGNCEKTQLKLMIELMGYPHPRFLSEGSKTRAFHNYFSEKIQPDPQNVPKWDETEVSQNLIYRLRKRTNDNSQHYHEEKGWDSTTNQDLQVLNVVYRMLQYEPSQRITAVKISKHRMFDPFR